jgi:16S rRNA (guanine966-N2)-methyltransferase
MTRLIGGKFRGRVLKTPKTSATRPTSAVVRKSIFDICKGEILEARVLDLFAGSGAMGCEALSRGAASATFVDSDARAIRCISENIASLQLQTCTTLMKTDVLKALLALSKKNIQFDIVIMDPPYHDAAIIPTLLTALLHHDILAPSATLFIEEGSPSHLTPHPHLTHLSTRTFGNTLLHHLTKK